MPLASTDNASSPAIEIRDLRVDFGEFTAVRGIDLKVPRGEILGLVGPNGAGKTTTLRVLATLLEPTYGDVLVGGFDVFEAPREVHRILGYMPDLAPVIGDLKVFEHLDLFAAAHGLGPTERRKRVNEVLSHVDLTEKNDAFCRTLSRGMMQRLILAQTLLHRPSVLLLDEPASGMDPMARIELRDTLRSLSREGATVLISSHILTELADICDSVVIMQKGAIITHGSIQDVLANWNRKNLALVIRFHGDAAPLQSFLSRSPLVSDPTFHRQEVALSFNAAAEEIPAFLKSIIEHGIAVSEFIQKRASIEDVLKELNRASTSSSSPKNNP